MPLKIKNKKNINNFSDRLKLAIGEHTYRSFSEVSGVAATTLRDYVTGKSFPTLDRLTAIADASGMPIEWLAAGELPNENMVPVLQYDLRVSAGHGSFVEMENPIAEFKFHVDWLRMQGLYGKTLSIVPVTGDSMEPTLQDSDLILVRHDETKDGVCVIRIDQDVLVKRVQYDYETGAYIIMSDNQRYKAFQIDKEFKGDFEIIGQVVRVLQRVKQYDPVM